MPLTLRRRHVLLAAGAFALPLRPVWASAPTELTWEELIPPGVPYSEIIGEGDYDAANDTWRPVFDENATKVVEQLNGRRIKLPGFSIPLEFAGDGVTEFILAPYVGACIHVPPPPANQLVYVTTDAPYPSGELFDAIWVIGTIRAHATSTELAEIGYAIEAERIETYIWE